MGISVQWLDCESAKRSSCVESTIRDLFWNKWVLWPIGAFPPRPLYNGQRYEIRNNMCSVKHRASRVASVRLTVWCTTRLHSWVLKPLLLACLVAIQASAQPLAGVPANRYNHFTKGVDLMYWFRDMRGRYPAMRRNQYGLPSNNGSGHPKYNEPRLQLRPPFCRSALVIAGCLRSVVTNCRICQPRPRNSTT